LGRGVRQIDLNRGHSRISCALARTLTARACAPLGQKPNRQGVVSSSSRP
jgi:hypothetical protein